VSQSNDAGLLLSAQQAQKVDHIWIVYFQAKIDNEDLTEEDEEFFEDEDEMGWIHDSVTVGGTGDGETIVAKAKEYVFSGRYGFKATEFRLKGAKILAFAEVV
jgi:hypothetical protein